MAVDFQFWLINIGTAALLTSPLFFVLPYKVTISLLSIVPVSIVSLYYYFSLPKYRASVSQFTNITIAHRGGQPLVPSCDNDFPENTMAAYHWASITSGADAIELDVWLSRDLVPMINHDPYLEHTFANCPHFIWSLTCAELKQLKYLKKNKIDVYDHAGCQVIPTLEEVIIFLEPTKLKLMIEIKELNKKDQMARTISNLYEKYPFLYERAYCAAFHPYNIYAIRRINPSIATAFLFVSDLTAQLIRNANLTPKPIPALLSKNIIVRWIVDSIFKGLATPTGLRFLGADLLCIEHRELSKLVLNNYKKANIVVCAWVVNESEQKRWLQTSGVTIITDTLFDSNH